MEVLTRFTLGLLFSVLVSCGASDSLTQETTTRGSIKIATDDSYSRLIDTEIATFESLYKYAHVDWVAGPESDMMKLLLADSVRAIVLSRELNQDEKRYLEEIKVLPKTTKICVDGLAFVVNKDVLDSNFTFIQLKSIVQGEIISWNQLDTSSTDNKLQLVFDHAGSGNARYLKTLFQVDALPPTCFAVNSNQEVIHYVENNPHAIGVIGSNWISDPDDSISGDFMSRVRLVGVSSENDPNGVLGFHRPYQGYLADKSYPFRRDVYIINRELGTRLATGFASFVAGDKGQRIVLKAGLVPAYGVIRLVNVNSGN
jgi:phosphate transport system substrate-binding protein